MPILSVSISRRIALCHRLTSATNRLGRTRRRILRHDHGILHKRHGKRKLRCGPNGFCQRTSRERPRTLECPNRLEIRLLTWTRGVCALLIVLALFPTGHAIKTSFMNLPYMLDLVPMPQRLPSRRLKTSAPKTPNTCVNPNREHTRRHQCNSDGCADLPFSSSASE